MSKTASKISRFWTFVQRFWGFRKTLRGRMVLGLFWGLGLLGFATLLLGFLRFIGFFSGNQPAAFPGPGALSTSAELFCLLGFLLLHVAGCAGFFVLAALSVARPLFDIERSGGALAHGELQRPVTVAPTATAEIRELGLVWEEMRRALVTKLRSSTELNLQLESEVARRSAELSRRNAELSEALERLRTTRDELLRTEKLAAVGRIAASVTSAINTPVSGLAALPAPLTATFKEVEELLRATEAPIDLEVQQQLSVWLTEMDGMLERLLRGAMRVRDIVRAMRVYARPAGPPDLKSEAPLAESKKPSVVLDDVLRLVSEPGDGS